MNNEVERNSTKKSLCLWFHNPMASKANNITRTPSIAANEAKKFLFINSKLCDPITEYNDNIANLRPKTEWALYGRPLLSNRRNKIPSNKLQPQSTNVDNIHREKTHRENTKSDNPPNLLGPPDENYTSDSDTDFSEDSQISIITKSDESSLYNLKDVSKFAQSNPIIAAYDDEDGVLSTKPFKMWHSNVTFYAMDIMSNVKMAVDNLYNEDFSNNYSSESITNDTPIPTPIPQMIT